jgi:hypothetical protein
MVHLGDEGEEQHYLKAVEHIVPGDCVLNPLTGSGAVVKEHFRENVTADFGLTPVYKYMGLRMSAFQVFRFGPSGFLRACDIITPELEETNTTHCIILDAGNMTVSADGVTCATLDTEALNDLRLATVSIKMDGVQTFCKKL